jgi:hypothetical protein
MGSQNYATDRGGQEISSTIPIKELVCDDVILIQLLSVWTLSIVNVQCLNTE